MASITITLPESGLIVSISVRERLTGSLDFSGTMINTPTVPDIGPTKSYTFDFTEVADTDYTYIITAPGGYEIEGTIYRDSSGGSGGLTPTQATQLANTVKKGDTLLNLGDIILPL